MSVKTLSIAEAGKLYFGLGRGASYNAAKRGDLIVIGAGRRKRVPIAAMERKMVEAGHSQSGAKPTVVGND
jgi:hypothetical protein